jgi:phage terminase small subunit
MSLNPRQRRFVAEYLVVGVGKTAAVRAGYAAGSAHVTASRLLAKPHVAAAIREGWTDQERRTGVTVDRVLLELARIAFSDLRRVADWDADRLTLKPADAISDDDRAAMVAVSVAGKRVRRVRVRLHDKHRALDALARHFNLYGPTAGKLDPRAADDGATNAREEIMARFARLMAKTE